MPICPNCKAEYIRGKRICSYCGEELYRGLMTDLSEDKNIIKQVQWSRVSNTYSDEVADEIIKRLAAINVPAIKRSSGVPFEEFSAFQANNIEILVPQGMENKADEIIN